MRPAFVISLYNNIANQPDTRQKMTNSLLVNVDIPMNTKRIPKD